MVLDQVLKNSGWEIYVINKALKIYSWKNKVMNKT